MKLRGTSSIFEITSLGRTNPHSTDDSDGRWIKTELDIKLNGFSSHQNIELFDSDFSRFYESIQNSLEDFSKLIVFSTLEESIYLEGKIQQNGQVYWEGYTIYPIGNGNKLSFKFETELAQIDILVKDLKRDFINQS